MPCLDRATRDNEFKKTNNKDTIAGDGIGPQVQKIEKSRDDDHDDHLYAIQMI